MHAPIPPGTAEKTWDYITPRGSSQPKLVEKYFTGRAGTRGMFVHSPEHSTCSIARTRAGGEAFGGSSARNERFDRRRKALIFSELPLERTSRVRGHRPHFASTRGSIIGFERANVRGPRVYDRYTTVWNALGISLPSCRPGPLVHGGLCFVELGTCGFFAREDSFLALDEHSSGRASWGIADFIHLRRIGVGRRRSGRGASTNSLTVDSYAAAPKNSEGKGLRLVMPANAGAGSSTYTANDVSIRAEAVGPVGRRVLPGVGVLSTDWNIRRLHVVPTDLPISQLGCREAWDSLTETQRHLLHHFERASWAGARICAHQISQESPDILRILLLILSSSTFENLRRESHKAGVRQKEWEFFIAYSNCFLTNLGNYLAFGDLKIVPGVSEDKFDAIVKASPLQGERKHRLLTLWEKTRKRIYSLTPGERTLGFPPNGRTAYYSEDITEEEVKFVAEWMKQEHIEPWNTRIWKRQTSGSYGSLPEYDLRIASALKFPIKTHVFQKKCVIHLIYGDFREDLEEVVRHLKKALPYASNGVECERLTCFIEYIETGSIDCHKKCQEIWLSNSNQKDNSIEFHLGFIETYHDPGGCRAEFEGFFAAVNKVATEKFSTLIKRADVLLPLLPWPKDYEADVFHCPAFTCIEVFFYANATIPAGINLPNYESVRQTHGSSNFCLANVVESHDTHLKTTFLAKQDEELSKSTKGDVFLVQLAFHELLGHGSGKLFTEDQGGECNFRRGTVMHPFTDEAVVTCYGPGDTWNSIFGQISAPYEECRAECVGIYLSANPQALEVFGHVGQRAEDIMYISWLMMARAGLLALEHFSVESGGWRQAHMQARFAILRTLLSAAKQEAEDSRARGLHTGSIFLEIKPIGLDNAVIHLNRDKIRSVGLPAIRDLLVKLQVYRSTADVKRGTELFIKLTTIPKEMQIFRDALLAQKRPRPMFTQINTKLVVGESSSRIEMEEFEPTNEGLIKSYIAHFRDWISHC